MLYSEMYCPASASASEMARLTSAGMRLENRCARRTSAHWRRLQLGAVFQALVERGEREIEQDGEGELVAERNHR